MKKVKQFRNCRGITLIVLVITVIVMLILAGVVINYALGEEGLIGRAEDASNRYQKAEKNEIALLDKVNQKYDDILNQQGGGNVEDIPLPSPSTRPTTVEEAKGRG